jgi:alpha-tubulin suppressor-like RCC1 family protein
MKKPKDDEDELRPLDDAGQFGEPAAVVGAGSGTGKKDGHSNIAPQLLAWQLDNTQKVPVRQASSNRCKWIVGGTVAVLALGAVCVFATTAASGGGGVDGGAEQPLCVTASNTVGPASACTSALASGITTLAACVANKFDSDGVASNGCEANCATGANTVGPASACTSALASGITTLAACVTNKFDSDGVASNGCEANCATGANTVGPASACTSALASGITTLAACVTNKFDSDGVASNGCEASCPTLANGTCTTCSAPSPSACTIAVCATTYVDSDGVASNGCEANCATGANTVGPASACTSTLASGITTLAACVANKFDSDGVASNGCEADSYEVWAFGNVWGTFRSTPWHVTSLGSDNANAAVGELHALVLKMDGTVWAAGDDEFGQTGLSRHVGGSYSTPTQVATLGTDNADVDAGFKYSLVLKKNGSLWGFGHNEFGQLGSSVTTRHSFGGNVWGSIVQVASLGNNIAALSAGGFHSLVLKTDGTVWAFGNNMYGQLGDGTTTHRFTPVQVSSLGTNNAAVEAGGYHSLVLKTDGTVWGFGYNRWGQLGDGTTTHRYTPVQVSSLGTNNVELKSGYDSITINDAHSLVRKTDGIVWGFGGNVDGQLGDGTGRNNRYAPVQSTALGSDNAELAAGGSYSLVRKTNGTLWTFGNNYAGSDGWGLLGDSTRKTTASQRLPTQVAALGTSNAKIVAGGWLSLILRQ